MPINDKKMYPIYAKCVELGIPVFCSAGIPGPRLKAACQHVELIDEVMFDFPDLVFVTRHGCEPWADLAVKLMLKWPGLHYSTSAFAPRYYPQDIIDYANTRGADKVIYAGYFPMGLSLERIMTELPAVGFKDEVWPKFLRDQRPARARVGQLRRRGRLSRSCLTVRRQAGQVASAILPPATAASNTGAVSVPRTRNS